MRQTEVVLNCLMPKSRLHNTNLLFIYTNAAYGYNLRVPGNRISGCSS